MDRIVAVIPARHASTRFPGKPLTPLLGKPMVLWVLERARQIVGVDEVLVATEDPRIARVVWETGGEAILTSPECPTGSDRVFEAVRGRACDIVLNLQGDEPALCPLAVGALVALMRSNADLQMGTLAVRLTDEAAFQDPNVVKVVLGERGRCLYFSRSPVPFLRAVSFSEAPIYRHIGIYAFRKPFLEAFTHWPQGALERVESLEQLRVLEMGETLRAAVVEWPPAAVDTPEDVPRAEAALRGLTI